ncbi:hypothetical protein LF41_1194 [Lysobacter dokdonensis DS-58]|uniref:Uncharacterized protein n=1 Tax=Lysobacter dokdonensis DS-58 TaxID=1300345 RepID=A0A0A2WKH0_9GAMM|nr:hypothetical protein LF41_1194 [Lysobacter dokdonensis DS-58]
MQRALDTRDTRRAGHALHPELGSAEGLDRESDFHVHGNSLCWECRAAWAFP